MARDLDGTDLGFDDDRNDSARPLRAELEVLAQLQARIFAARRFEHAGVESVTVATCRSRIVRGIEKQVECRSLNSSTLIGILRSKQDGHARRDSNP